MNAKESNETNLMKIPLLGLDNAGKTSLLYILKREFNELKMVEPTKSVDIVKCTFFNKKIYVWDFGGQEHYREKYFEEPKVSEYFSNITSWFYVVDILDKDRYEFAFAYFHKLIKIMGKYSPGNTCNVLINKVDPDTEDKEEIIENFNFLWDEFEKIGKDTGVKIVRVHQTSIENPISVIRAFSRPLFDNLTLYDDFSILFKELVEKLDISFIICFNQDLLEIGEHISPHVNQAMMRDLALAVFLAFNSESKVIEPDNFKFPELNVEIIEFQIRDEKFWLTYGFPKFSSHDKEIVRMDVEHLLNDIKKFMVY